MLNRRDNNDKSDGNDGNGRLVYNINVLSRNKKTCLCIFTYIYM